MRIYLKYILLLAVCSVFLDAQGQSLKNIRAETKGELVVITYDLEAPQADQTFNIKLYASHDNYRTPLKFVSGDVGEGISPGTNKRLEWDAKNEVQNFNGNITFEVRASMAMPAITFQNPSRDTDFKRGKTYQITWDGGAANKNYELELYRNGVKQQTLGTAENNRRYTWSIPTTVDNGKNYSIKLIDGSKTVAESQPFAIKRKIPLGLKIIPMAVGVGAGIYFILNSDTEPIIETPVDDSLPLPPPPDS